MIGKGCLSCFCEKKVHGEFGCFQCRCEIPKEECRLGYSRQDAERRSCENCVFRERNSITGTKPIAVVHLQTNGKKKRISANPGDSFSYCNKGYWGGIILDGPARKARRRMGRPKKYILADHAQLCADFHTKKEGIEQDDA